MDFNSKMGYSEQDYQLLKETTSGITGKVDKIVDDVAAKLPEIDFGPGSFVIEKDVPFYGFVAGHMTNSVEDVLGSPNLSCNPVSISGGVAYGNHPALCPVVWDGHQGSFIMYGDQQYYAVLFTLANETKPGTLTLNSRTNVYAIKTYLKD